MASTQARSSQSLRVERRFKASPARVFHAWTTTAELNLWSAPAPAQPQATVDLRVGGAYRILMSAPDGTVHDVQGVYRVIDPPRRLVYTWRWESKPDFPETVVTVEFRALPDGGTHLVLTHDGLPDQDQRDKHEHGWNGCLDKLGPVVQG